MAKYKIRFDFTGFLEWDLDEEKDGWELDSFLDRCYDELDLMYVGDVAELIHKTVKEL
jgi:hypothetical protein